MTPQAGSSQSAAGQTIAIPGLGSVTLNAPGVAPGAGGAATPTAPAGPTPPRPAKVPPAPPAASTVTSTGGFTPAFLQSETRAVHAALVAALPEAQRSRVAAIPLEIVDEPREPNAAAACTRSSRRPAMLITTAMLTLVAGIAETRAFDERTGGSSYEQFASTAASQLRGQQPITGVPAGLVAGPMAADQQKLARQLQLFDEQVAFILAHEIAHHHRGHTSCVGSGDSGRADAEELARLASSALPPFTQPLEVEADTWAVYTVLAAGSGRAAGSWDEEGGLVNLEFFGRLRRLGGADVLAVFLSTHPLPQLRRPIVQVAARGWAPGRWPPSSPAGAEGLTLPGGATLPIQIPGLTAP